MKNLKLSLFLLRTSVFIVIFFWTLDKFLNPAHAAAVYEHFYFVPSNLAMSFMTVIGIIEMIILLGFLAGLFKKWTYGAILLFHAISTLSSYKQYISPFTERNLLFFAAWPMLAACVALFLLRDEDTLLTFKKT